MKLLRFVLLCSLAFHAFPACAASRLIRVGLTTRGAPVQLYASTPLTIRDPLEPSHQLSAPAATTITIYGSSGAPRPMPDASRPIALGWGGILSGWKTIVVSGIGPIRLSTDGSNPRFAPRAYRGTLEVAPQGFSFEPSEHRGPLRLVNVLPLDEYLWGVVPWEMDADAPLESLKAQAICARSETLAKINAGRHARDGYDICDYDHCQGYRGTENEAASTTLAVRQTAGLVLMNGSHIADAVYGTNSGGITANAGDVWRGPPESYLRSVFDFSPLKHPATATVVKTRMSEADWVQFCTRNLPSYASPSPTQIRTLASRRARSPRTAALFGPDDLPEFYRWTRVVSPGELAKVLWARKPGVRGDGVPWPTVSEVRVSKRSPSGHIQKLTVIARHRNGSAILIVLEGDSQIRGLLSGRLGSTSSLPSSTFVVLPRRDARGVLTAFVLKGAGWGHGVGMCQRGAQSHARDGWKARDILNFYYRGLRIVKAY